MAGPNTALLPTVKDELLKRLNAARGGASSVGITGISAPLPPYAIGPHRPPITSGVSRGVLNPSSRTLPLNPRTPGDIDAILGNSSGSGSAGTSVRSGGGGGVSFGSNPFAAPVPGATIGGAGGIPGFFSDTEISNEVRDLLELELGPARRELERQLQGLFEESDLSTNQLGNFQNFGNTAIANAFKLGTTRQDELSNQLATLLQNSQAARGDIGGVEAATLAALDQIQGGSMLRRLSDFQTEGTQAQGDFQQQIAQGLLELQEATRTGSRDLRQQLADLESERGVLGSQLRREIARESFDRGRLTANDAFDQALARSTLEGSNLDRLLQARGLAEDARQFDLSHALDEMIANEQRNERVSQERDRFGDIISTSTIRDFLASSGAPSTAFQGFNSLLTYTGGDPAAMQEILAKLQAPAGPDNSPSANFNDLLRGMGPGANLVADKRNIPFIIDAINLYFG